MDEKISGLLSALDDEIGRKCLEIKQRKRNRTLQSAFLCACALFLLLPVLLVFLGISLWTFCIPAVLFLAICFCFLSPLVLGNKTEGSDL